MNKRKVKVLCYGWIEERTMYLTEEQLEQWRNNPLVVSIKVLED